LRAADHGGGDLTRPETSQPIGYADRIGQPDAIVGDNCSFPYPFAGGEGEEKDGAILISFS